jgi:hypothetical protein
MENGWEKYQQHVISELSRLDRSHTELISRVDGLRNEITVLRAEVAVLRTEVAVLKLKYGLLGGAIGAIPGIFAIFLRFV